MARLLRVVQSITNDHSKVAETLQKMLSQHNLDSSAIEDIEITKFGANQFLIVALFYGVYTLYVRGFLRAVVDRDITINRALSASAALSPVASRTLAKESAYQNSSILTPVFAHMKGFSRVLSAGISLVPYNEASIEMTEKLTGANLTASVEFTVSYNRALEASVELTSDESTVHTSP